MQRLLWAPITAIIGIIALALAYAIPAAAQATTAVAQDEGIPVHNDLVRARCGTCHRVDDQRRISRISYRRASPENWERTIKRMVTLNHVDLDPPDARAILKYLADHNGLAPEEVRPIAFEAERRLVSYTYAADKDTADICSSCHSIARAMSERRTKEEWELLVSMHRGYYPRVDDQPMNGGQGFRRTRPVQTEPGPDGSAPDNRHPMERALAHLSTTFPLKTSDWASWSAAMQPVKLTGRWAISGYGLGKGPIFGLVVIAADPNMEDSFNTETRYTVARTGETVTRTGKAIVYTGFQWRGRGEASGGGRSTSSGSPRGSSTGEMPWREVMLLERDWKQMSGRWFTGAYDETGIDVKLVRLTSEPVVFGTSVTALRTGSTAQPVKIYGANLPATLRPEDIGFGQGIKVARIVNAGPDELAIEVDVAANAPIGARDISISSMLKPSVLAVYDKIDAVRVMPQAGLARVGGAVFPKQSQQFEAVGLNNGPDGKPGTSDDLNLGVVNVKWSLEEYTATFGDDDAQFVGTLDATGLFTPSLDGPNPKRSGNRNNVGDVWVVAELVAADGGPATRPLRGRAHLLVTVPVYMGWYESEGGR